MKNPNVVWQSAEQLYSIDYDDTYSSSEGWLDEKEYVFLKSNHLSDNWKNKNIFSIFELGFGSGANFVLTWNLWKQTQETVSYLYYNAIEKQTLKKRDILNLFQNHTLLRPLVDKFLDVYHIEEEGVYSFSFPEDRVHLTLWIGDVLKLLPLFTGKVDTWFLDGFSPSKNPEMWSEDVFYWISQKSYDGSCLSTYSSATRVKKLLETYGFSTQKIDGFGKKREMLRGIFFSQNVVKEKKFSKRSMLDTKLNPSWYKIPTLKTSLGLNKQTAVVVGGGLAGTSIAYSLAKKGWKIKLIEKESKIATQASGNPFGIASSIIAKEKVPLLRFVWAAFSNFLTHIEELKSCNVQFERSGLLKLIPKEQELNELKKFLSDYSISESTACIVDQKQAKEISGVNLKNDCIYFPLACYVSPPEICQANLNSANIEVIHNSKITKIECQNDLWQVLDSSNNLVAEGDCLVLANGFDCLQFEQTKWLPIKKMRGQIAFLPERKPLQNLKTILQGDCYILPAKKGYHIVGSTYNPYDMDLHFKPEQNLILTEKIQAIIPEIQPMEDLDGRVGFRTVSKDHFPLVGPVPDKISFIEDYIDIWKGKPADSYKDGRYIKGLYISVGHGSRGIIYSHLAAEVLTDMICNSPIGLEKDLLDNINPARFIIRDLISRKKIQ